LPIQHFLKKGSDPEFRKKTALPPNFYLCLFRLRIPAMPASAAPNKAGDPGSSCV
jgi:hypothetical protein